MKVWGLLTKIDNFSLNFQNIVKIRINEERENA